MTADEFLEYIKEQINWLYFEKTKRAEIEDFLLGKTEEIIVSRHKMHFYNSDTVYYEIMKELDTDNKEMAKRAFNLFCQLIPERTMHYFKRLKNQFEAYHKAGIDVKFVEGVIVSLLNEEVKYYGTYFKDKVEDWRKENKCGKHQHEWEYMFVYYGELIQKMTAHFHTNDPKKQMAYIILCALSLEKYHTEEYIKKMELNLYAMIQQIYDADKIENAFECYFEDSKAKDFCHTVKASTMFYSKDIIRRTQLVLSSIFCQESPLIMDSLKLSLALIESSDYLQDMGSTPEEMEELYKQFQLPNTFVIELYAEEVLKCAFQKEGQRYIKKLEQWILENKEVFKTTFETKLKSGEISYVVLLSLFLKHSQTDELFQIKMAEEVMIDYMTKMSKMNARGGSTWFSVKRRGELCSDFSILHKEVLDFDTMKMYCNPYGPFSKKLVIAAASLFDYSVVARNIMGLFIAVSSERAEGSNIGIFCKAQKLFSTDPSKNPYELLAEWAGVKRVIRNYVVYENAKDSIGEFREFLKNHLTEAIEELKDRIASEDSHITKYITLFYEADLNLDYKIIIPVLNSSSKLVVNFMEEFLSDKEEQVKSYVEPLKESKNKNTKDTVNRLLRKWGAAQLLENLNKIQTVEELVEFVLQDYDKANNRILPFKGQIDFSCVRYKNSEQYADEILLKYYVAQHLLLKQLYHIKFCDKIKEFLNPDDFYHFIKNIYQLWLENGADTKLKNIVFMYAVNTNDSGITELKKQIDTWTDNSRGALAAFAVTAMAMNGSDIALLLTDGISNKYKNKQVKKAAAEAMNTVAKALGISTEALGDKIIPNLGFNKQRVKIFSYGNREFKGFLNGKLEVELTDEKGKKIKSLPKANASDNAELAAIAKEELKNLKKQLKTVILTQKNRLETALITGRQWTVENWNKLFIDNPIMNSFAQGLIWKESDETGQMFDTFRYMEDGSFNTIEEEEYSFHANTFISLLHPIDVEKEIIERWSQQLEDYEIIQPFEQLTMPIYTLTSEEKTVDEIVRFLHKKVYYGTIRSVMEKYDWKRTSIIDGGGFEGYYYEDKQSGIGMQLLFDFLYIGMAPNETADMGKLTFYKEGTIEYGSYCYDEIKKSNRILPKDVPDKIMSLALMIGELIAQKEIVS